MTDFETKRQELAEHAHVLQQHLIRLFPAGGPITWRSENSFNETGTVIQHFSGRIRVVDDRGNFFSVITVDDIVRATP